MLTQEQSVDIQVLHKQGVSIRGIAKQLHISRNTVRRYLREQSITPQYTTRHTKPSKLEPYYSYLQERIAAAKPHWIPATVLFQEIKAKGYVGREGILRNYVRQFKPENSDPVVRFETPPGKQLQIDFTTIRRGKHKLKAFVATLGYSRASYVYFSECERQDDGLTGIQQALDYFGGVPEELLFDNAKCLMIERDAYAEGQHRWNPSLLALSRDYGFRLRACKPYRAKTKGKVERFNGYLKSSFTTPLAASLNQAGLVLDVTVANAHIGPWLTDIAHQRIHGTTGQQPQVLLDKERQHFAPLPVSTIGIKSVARDKEPLVPIERFQHPLASYDQLLEVAL